MRDDDRLMQQDMRAGTSLFLTIDFLKYLMYNIDIKKIQVFPYKSEFEGGEINEVQ